MPIATGVFKNLVYKKEATLNTLPGASGAQLLRRVTSNLDYKKATYKSSEIRSDMQRSDFRHGVVSVEGTVAGELSVGTYKDFMASLLRQDFQTAATATVTTVTAAVTVAPAGTFTSTGGTSFITGGIKVGDVVRCTGWTTGGVANNAHNFLVTAVTATVLTVTPLDGVSVAAKASEASVVVTATGKKTWIPTTGHTNQSYSIEHAYTDITQSEVFTGCKITQANVKLPATGMATVDFSVMGLGMTTNTTAYYTAPTAASTGTALAAVNGLVFVGGVAVALITGMDFTINGNYSSGEVIGSNTKPDIFPGSIDVSGNMSVYFQDATFRDYFKNETEVALTVVLTAGTAANADFQVWNFPRVKVGGASKDDGEKGLIMTMPFTALYNTSGGTATTLSTLATTVSVQDSLA